MYTYIIPCIIGNKIYTHTMFRIMKFGYYVVAACGPDVIFCFLR